MSKTYMPPIDETQKELDLSRENRYEVVWDYVLRDGKEHPVAVICPGGAYFNVCSYVEGVPFARHLNSRGISAVIVYYRVKEQAIYPNPQDDLARAVKEVLDRAEELKLDVKNYSVWGSSAGGHLAASFGTENMGYIKYGLPKPAAEILIYPVITMNAQYTNDETRDNLIGIDPTEEMVLFTSVERQVTENYPATYIWCGEADGAVPPKNTLDMGSALKAAKVPYRLETFPGVEHGVGLATGIAAEGWIDHAIDFWMEQVE